MRFGVSAANVPAAARFAWRGLSVAACILFFDR